jgi:hypothetical protein
MKVIYMPKIYLLTIALMLSCLSLQAMKKSPKVEADTLAAVMTQCFYPSVKAVISYQAQSYRKNTEPSLTHVPSKIDYDLEGKFQQIYANFFNPAHVGTEISQLESADTFKSFLQTQLESTSAEKIKDINDAIDTLKPIAAKNLITKAAEDLTKKLTEVCFSAVQRKHTGTLTGPQPNSSQAEVEAKLVTFFDEKIYAVLRAKKSPEERYIPTEEYNFRKKLIRLFEKQPDKIEKLRPRIELLFKKHQAAKIFAEETWEALHKENDELRSRYSNCMSLEQRTAKLSLNPSLQKKSGGAQTIWRRYISPQDSGTLIRICKTEANFRYTVFNAIIGFDSATLEAFIEDINELRTPTIAASTSAPMPTIAPLNTRDTKRRNTTGSKPPLLSPRERARTELILKMLPGNKKDKKNSHG